ncbi:MAG TPA: peptidylprolyl isomerase [Blastocatellia bacterium]|nr:peptidylprolyl isomerase [Blastocatellia bacterium]
MKIKTALVGFALLGFVLSALSCGGKTANDDEVAVLETSYGRIVIEFLPKVAPKHTANFKALAQDGFFDGTKFHRIVLDKGGKPIAIQGGDPNTIAGDPATWGQGQPGQNTVPAEFSSMKHERGIVSMARKGNDINSGTSQFFIMTAAQPGFDGQYSIFGRVIEGMNVVDTIARAPVVQRAERPVDPVVLNRAYVVMRDEVK